MGIFNNKAYTSNFSELGEGIFPASWKDEKDGKNETIRGWIFKYMRSDKNGAIISCTSLLNCNSIEINIISVTNLKINTDCIYPVSAVKPLLNMFSKCNAILGREISTEKVLGTEIIPEEKIESK